jgi:2-polyprenyl-3-methyl-5-hydroxy-6-metoxy-1,4-benzoquinol methylase
VKGARQAFDFSFEYLFCSDCKSLSIKDIPENLSFFYKNYYSLQEFEKSSSIRKMIEKVIFLSLPFHLKSFIVKNILNKEDDFKLTSLLQASPRKNWDILDVGSGSGDFVYNLHELGFKRSIGIDPFLNESVQYENGAKILKNGIMDMNDKYDLITFHHSFEHLIEPSQYLYKVSKLLKPKGICLIRLPNIDCWSYKYFKEHWVGIHAPYHVFLPSYTGMEMLLKPHGLKINSCLGEQVIDFFLISKENFMGITINQKDSIRSLIKEKRSISYTPWHCKKELTYWKSMKKLVEKNNICDCVAYYITHE